MRPMTLYLDLDGVLADFVGGVCALRTEWGAAMEFQAWPAGTYDMPTVLGITPEQMWSEIHARGAGFWSQLARYSWANQLYNYVRTLGDVYILSAPSGCPWSAAGKMIWIADQLPSGSAKRVILTAHKHLLAHDRAMLIDDCPEQCDRFRAAGGQAILFPQPWSMTDFYELRNRTTALSYIRRQCRKLGIA